jgi:hypothetical protein
MSLTSFLPVLPAHGADVSLHGYFKNFLVAVRPPKQIFFLSWSRQDMIAWNTQRLRLKSHVDMLEPLSVHVSYDLSFRVQDSESDQTVLNLLSGPTYRVSDVNSRIYPASDERSNLYMLQNLDRLYAHVTLPNADLYVGRQALSWGSARIINPTDVIAPFSFNELDKEERTGVDAVRLRIPMGMMSELDVGYVAGDRFEADQSAGYIRAKLYAFQSDLSVLAMVLHEHLMIGVDVARAIGQAGFWMESALTRTETFSKSVRDRDHYVRLSIGMDYNLASTLYGYVEYHYNGCGSSSPDDYIASLMRSPAYREGAVYLLGRHYLIPGLEYQWRPLMTLSMQSLCNLSDQSLYWAPKLEYNISQNIYLAAGAYVGIGASPSPLDIESEFGVYPDVYFTSFRVYF